jgi:hypothetical protein
MTMNDGCETIWKLAQIAPDSSTTWSNEPTPNSSTPRSDRVPDRAPDRRVEGDQNNPVSGSMMPARTRHFDR